MAETDASEVISTKIDVPNVPENKTDSAEHSMDSTVAGDAALKPDVNPAEADLSQPDATQPGTSNASPEAMDVTDGTATADASSSNAEESSRPDDDAAAAAAPITLNPSSSSDAPAYSDGPEYHVVEQCRSVKGDTAWVQFVGYPKSRNLWRSIGQHFPLLEGGADVLAAHSRVKMSVRALATPLEEGAVVIKGRKPPQAGPRGDIAEKQRPAAERAYNDGPAPPPKKKRRDFESRVHTIRIDDDGIHEIRGVRRAGGVDVDSKQLLPMPERLSSTTSIASAASSSSAAAHANGNNGGASSSADNGTDGCPSLAPPNLGNGVGGDERSDLWAAHRIINESALSNRNPKGHMFRIEVTEVTSDSQANLSWIFPESSPGDASAWIGLWDANDFDWATGQPRPRYIRYKSLTSLKQEGVSKFTAKEWAGLPNGEYLFSIDTGGVECGAADSIYYCVSQVRQQQQRVCIACMHPV